MTIKNVVKKLERYQEYFDTRGEEILKLRKENEKQQQIILEQNEIMKTLTVLNERYRKALMRYVDDETVTWEQTETIAKRALELPPFNKERAYGKTDIN